MTAFTDSLDPIKLYEYQAVGRPVVSTAVAGFRETDDDRIVVAYAPTFQMLSGDARAGVGTSPTTDRVVADWNERADAMLGILSRMQRTSPAP